ncbi:MAG: protein-glutamate O-methyltransferase CheR [Betaproteobacteria bacterium]|nr:protein-glutamate O-methyltransferase CheR [Betaproteobacteria bacterium]
MILTNPEFDILRKLLHESAGIHLTPEKKALVVGRLGRRIGELGLKSFGDYFLRIASGTDPEERQWAFNALTTNETSFFREPRHFAFLSETILAKHPRGETFRVWSAASSTGEEPYSIAMVLAERLGKAPWEVVASDLSTKVLDQARRAIYPMARAERIPKPYLRDFCLKGTGPQAGGFSIDRWPRERVRFMQVNLVAPLPDLGRFDLIFLRNVLIYFDPPTKRKVVESLLRALKPGGHFFSGHSESLTGMVPGLTSLQPAVYRKPE